MEPQLSSRLPAAPADASTTAGAASATSSIEDCGDLFELIEVRRLFEPVAAALAADRASSADLAEVAARLKAMAAARGDAAAFHRQDIAFHRAVSSTIGNETLASLLDAVSARTVLAVSPRRIAERESVDAVLAEHAAILAALAARDSTLAHAASLVHVNSIETWLREDLAGHRGATAPGPRPDAVA